MKKCMLLFLLIHAINGQVQSQINGSSFLNRTEYKVGYYGNFIWNNGLKLGTEYVWKEKKKVKDKKEGQKTITHQFLLHGSLGFSTNFTNQTENSFHTYYGLIWRRTSHKRWQLSVEINPLGYYRSILPETFEIEGNEVSKVNIPGRSYYAPTFVFGIGRLNKSKKLAWYLNLNFGFRTPYNAGVLPMFALQYGYRFNFKNKKSCKK